MKNAYCSTWFGALLRRVVVAVQLAVVLAVAVVHAQSGKAQYEPQVGQEGKDVIWVPTPQALVERMLDIAKVTPKDYVIDLGSGDGRTVIAAAEARRQGARRRVQPRYGGIVQAQRG